LKLAPHERRELKKMAASRTMKAGEVRRAKVILRLAARAVLSNHYEEGCGQDFVARWKRAQGLGQLPVVGIVPLLMYSKYVALYLKGHA
jgi:hypothetical protein